MLTKQHQQWWLAQKRMGAQRISHIYGVITWLQEVEWPSGQNPGQSKMPALAKTQPSKNNWVKYLDNKLIYFILYI